MHLLVLSALMYSDEIFLPSFCILKDDNVVWNLSLVGLNNTFESIVLALDYRILESHQTINETRKYLETKNHDFLISSGDLNCKSSVSQRSG